MPMLIGSRQEAVPCPDGPQEPPQESWYGPMARSGKALGTPLQAEALDDQRIPGRRPSSWQVADASVRSRVTAQSCGAAWAAPVPSTVAKPENTAVATSPRAATLVIARPRSRASPRNDCLAADPWESVLSQRASTATYHVAAVPAVLRRSV